MAANRTRETGARASAFLGSIEDPAKHADARKVAAMMKKATGNRPGKRGDSIVGFGHYHYHYASGRAGDFMLTGFSPRKQALKIYIMPGFDSFRSLLDRLGRYKTGKFCPYIRRLEDVDEAVLERRIGKSVEIMHERYDTR